MEVKVIHLEGCGATPPTISLIQKVAKDLGVKIHLERVVVKTTEEAKKFRHIGSPTVQINGLDIEADARDVKNFGLT